MQRLRSNEETKYDVLELVDLCNRLENVGLLTEFDMARAVYILMKYLLMRIDPLGEIENAEAEKERERRKAANVRGVQRPD